MTDTLEKPALDTVIDVDFMPYEDSDDPTRRTHIVNPPRNMHIWQEGMTAQEVVDIARATGQIITTLCGHKFIPVHNPEKYPACSNCFEIAGLIDRSM